MIYVAGKIRNLDNYKLLFNAAKKYLNKQGLKHVTAVELLERINYNQTTEKAIINEINSIIYDCDSVYVLPNWEKSKGTKFEIEIAKYYNKNIVYMNWNELFDETFTNDFQYFFNCDFSNRNDANKLYRFLLLNYLSNYITSYYKLGLIIYSKQSNAYSTVLNAKSYCNAALKGKYGIDIQKKFQYKKLLIEKFIEGYYAS